MRQVSSVVPKDEIEALGRYTAAQLAMIELGLQCNFVNSGLQFTFVPLAFQNVKLNGTLGSSNSDPPITPLSKLSLCGTRKETGHTTWALLRSMSRRPGATPTRKRNCRELMFFFF